MRAAPNNSAGDIFGWNSLRVTTLLVYIFMFAPIIVVILLAFNSSRSGSFPMEGFSLQWFGKLFSNQSIVDAFKTSLILACTSSLLATALGVMQDCRIRWGTVESVDGEHAMIASPPLRLADGVLTLGDPQPEQVQWKKGELSLAPAPAQGSIVAAHWNWVCGTLDPDQHMALQAATQATLDLVNTLRGGRQ